MDPLAPIYCVPDSVLSSFLALNQERLVVTSCEGEAVVRASVRSIETGTTGFVAIQNSGLGNTVNVLTSFVDLYRKNMSVKILIGWRGMPGIKDEPQHKAMGAMTENLLDLLGFDTALSSSRDQVDDFMREDGLRGSLQALLVPPGQLGKARIPGGLSGQNGKVSPIELMNLLVSESKSFDAVIVSTGFNSRLFFEMSGITPHYLDSTETSPKVIYNVGAMGFSCAIGVEYKNLGANALVIDGDGSALMHFGSYQKDTALLPKIVVFCNDMHESVGGFATSMTPLFDSFGIRPDFVVARDLAEVRSALANDAVRVCLVSTEALPEKISLGRPI